MATAIEKAAIVIVCLSQKYKESPNCRTEADYTFRLKKKIVPIRLQPRYYPDGWLGLMVGSKLVTDFSDAAKSQESFRHLVKELGHNSKGTADEVDCVKATSVPVNNALNYPSHDKTSPIKFWTKDEIGEWIKQNNLEHVRDWFSAFTGPLLMEYNAMRQEAPEAFFAYLMKKDILLPDALAISCALKNL